MRERLSKKLLIEISLILSCTIISVLLGYYGSIVTLSLIVLVYLLRKSLEGSFEIYSDKKLLFIFIIVYLILSMNVFFTAFRLYKYLGFNEEYAKGIIKIIGLTLSLILLKVFGIRIRSFKWNMSRSQIIGSLLIGFVFISINIYSDGLRFNNSFNGDISQYSLYILKTALLVAFFEEFLCRGILISALKGYQIAEWKANIIQALLFGILHCVKYLDRGIGIALLITTYQILAGYFFGKLYLKTKTLMPGVLLHFLWDVVWGKRSGLIGNTQANFK